MNSDIRRAIKLIDKNEYISFDLYDTLIYRAAESPIYVFNMVENIFKGKYGRNIDSFINKRVSIEKTIYKKNNNVTLAQIYNVFPDISDKEKDALKKIEEDIEKKISYPSEYGMRLYQYAVKKRKKIYIITDMYLSFSCIRKILDKCGYQGVSDKNVYISNEKRAWKSQSANLFRLFLKREHIQAKQLCHFGDNLKNDVLLPRTIGISTYYINNNIYKEIPYRPCFLNDKSTAFKFGFNYFGALTLGYVQWVHKQAIKHRLEKIYFFSREGFLYKKIYDELYTDIPSEYWLFGSLCG